VLDITDDELAKYHIRHMVGGHTPASVNDERVYRFEFPERPGALLNFLRKLGKQFNISLFHYRNHGAAFGRVLVGLQVAEDKQEQLQNTLQEVGYAYVDETNNMTYQLFLR
jgi:threonine dehydratase